MFMLSKNEIENGLKFDIFIGVAKLRLNNGFKLSKQAGDLKEKKN